MGFIRHNSLNWNVTNKKSRSQLTQLLDRNLRSTLSNYAIPSEVAPQQSFGPLYVIVMLKIEIEINLLTLSFPHLIGYLGTKLSTIFMRAQIAKDQRLRTKDLPIPQNANTLTRQHPTSTI